MYNLHETDCFCIHKRQKNENCYPFYLTGETSETMINLENLIVLHDTREHMLSARSRILLFVI